MRYHVAHVLDLGRRQGSSNVALVRRAASQINVIRQGDSMLRHSITRYLSSISLFLWGLCAAFPEVLKAVDHAPDGSNSSPVYVVLWFDTEDYILPASDDAVLRIASFLSSVGVKATFKVVGEK